MIYYNEFFEIINKDIYDGFYWGIEVNNNLKPGKDETVVIDLKTKTCKIQSTKENEWNKYLQSINKLNLPSNQTLDKDGKIIFKTKSDLLKDDIITKEKYLEILSKEIDIYFNNVLLKGVNYNNYVFRTDENSLNRINNAIQENFLYDELTPYWISEYRIDTNLNKIPDSENSFYPIDSIQTLKFLAKTLKDHWKQCFFKRRKLLDNIIKLSKDELLNFNIAIEWDKV